MYLVVVPVLLHALLQVDGWIPALLCEVVPITSLCINALAPSLPNMVTSFSPDHVQCAVWAVCQMSGEQGQGHAPLHALLRSYEDAYVELFLAPSSLHEDAESALLIVLLLVFLYMRATANSAPSMSNRCSDHLSTDLGQVARQG